MKDDYGYFGKGIDGYVHYKQTFDQAFPQGSTGTYRSKPTPSDQNNAILFGLAWRSGLIVLSLAGWLIFLVRLLSQ